MKNLHPRRCKVSYTEATDTTIVALQNFYPPFSDMFQGVKYANINPFNCICFTKIRASSNYGVLKLIHLFQKSTPDNNTTISTGLAFGSYNSVVFSLKSVPKCVVYKHFIEYGMPDDDNRAKVKSVDIWYAIVVGKYSN